MEAELPDDSRALLVGDDAAARPRRDEPVSADEFVQLVAKDLPRSDVAAARELMASLQRYTDGPLLSARLTLRHPETRRARLRWIAYASVNIDGRLLAAHATGRNAIDAAQAAVDRLRRQLRRVVGKEVALRNEPCVIAPGSRPRGGAPSATGWKRAR